MDNSNLVKKGKRYKYNFVYGNINNITKVFDFPEGIFFLGQQTENRELYWGVNKLKDLKKALDKIKSKTKNLSFVFRYASDLEDVIENKEEIMRWGYEYKKLYIGYFLKNMSKQFLEKEYQNIEVLNLRDMEEVLALEREIFSSLNISKEELEKLINDGIVLGYRKDEKIVGFLFIEIFGENKNSCFIRSLGVKKEERKQGIGEKLLRKGLKLAIKRDVKNSMLWVDIKNIPARSLYEKVGYKQNKNEAEVIFKFDNN